MATCAVRSCKRGSGRRMLGVCSSQPIRHVASRACSGKPNVISGSGILVASIALHDGVCAEKREAVEMVLNRLIGYLPAERRMALSAVTSHLCAVNVRVAIGAIFSNVSENGLRVATRAGYFRVHSAERIFRGVVIEFGDSANRSPA
jgi:hypothetical protein